MSLFKPHGVVVVRWPAGWAPKNLRDEPPQQTVERVELSYVKPNTARKVAADFNREQSANGRKLWAIVRKQAVDAA